MEVGLKSKLCIIQQIGFPFICLPSSAYNNEHNYSKSSWSIPSILIQFDICTPTGRGTSLDLSERTIGFQLFWIAARPAREGHVLCVLQIMYTQPHCCGGLSKMKICAHEHDEFKLFNAMFDGFVLFFCCNSFKLHFMFEASFVSK